MHKNHVVPNIPIIGNGFTFFCHTIINYFQNVVITVNMCTLAVNSIRFLTLTLTNCRDSSDSMEQPSSAPPKPISHAYIQALHGWPITGKVFSIATAGLLHAVAAVFCSLSELKLKKHGIHCKCTHIHINNKIMKVVDYGVAKNYKSIANNRNLWKYMIFMHLEK